MSWRWWRCCARTMDVDLIRCASRPLTMAAQTDFSVYCRSQERSCTKSNICKPQARSPELDLMRSAPLKAVLMSSEARKVPDRRKAWSQRDDNTLLALKAAGVSGPAIAKRLGRTPVAITSRLIYLRREGRLRQLLDE